MSRKHKPIVTIFRIEKVILLKLIRFFILSSKKKEPSQI